MKNEKNYVGFLMSKVWQILKHFDGTFHWAQTLKLWGVCFKANVSNQTWLFKFEYYLKSIYARELCYLRVCMLFESILCTINGASSVNRLFCRWTVWVSAGPPRPLIYAWKGLRKSSVYLCRYTHQQHSHICADFSTSASWLHLPRVKNIPTMLEPI